MNIFCNLVDDKWCSHLRFCIMWYCDLQSSHQSEFPQKNNSWIQWKKYALPLFLRSNLHVATLHLLSLCNNYISLSRSYTWEEPNWNWNITFASLTVEILLLWCTPLLKDKWSVFQQTIYIDFCINASSFCLFFPPLDHSAAMSPVLRQNQETENESHWE